MLGVENKSAISHPSHYQSETGMEVIDVIEAFTFDLDGIEAFNTGNIIKYICRWKKKNGIEDLKKAQWYLQHLIDHVEKLEAENLPVVENEVFKCKHCSVTLFGVNQDDCVEDQLWEHLKLCHEDVYEEVKDLDTLAMIEQAYDVY